MDEFWKSLTMSYLIYPLLGLVLVGLGIFIAKKNELLANKRLVISFFVSILVLTLPALGGLLDYNFMPYGYTFLLLLYAILGWYNIKLIRWIFKDGCSFKVLIIFFLFQQLIAMALFALVFNLCNEMHFGILASASMIPFIITPIFIKTYDMFMDIPIPIYEVWKYSESEYPEEYYDPGTLQVIQIEIYKSINDPEPTKINAKAPEEIEFGRWFRRMLDDYNTRSPLSPIETQAGIEDTGWVFYVRTFLSKHIIDSKKNIAANKIKNKYIVVAKRVQEKSE